MAAIVNPLRLCLRTARHVSALRGNRLTRLSTRTSFSTTSRRWATSEAPDDAVEEGDGDGDGRGEYRVEDIRDVLAEFSKDPSLTEDERNELTEALRKLKDDTQVEPKLSQANVDGSLAEAFGRQLAPLKRQMKPKRNTFWHEDETDEDLITDEIGEDEFDEDDILSMAHGKLEEHREAREYARVAVWEMPLLSKLAKPFEIASQDQPLRFRYTSYMGEFHPAERKVVVEFCPNDMPLDQYQREKLKKLCGARYNPEKDIIKMSCDKFEHQAQNKRYLGDLVEKLIEEAKNPADMFEDIPLDVRHHKIKTKPKFPCSWKMSESRRDELQALRQHAFLRDLDRENKGKLVDGKQTVAKALDSIPEARIPVQVLARPEVKGRGTGRTMRW